jgi:hypothetical protein
MRCGCCRVLPPERGPPAGHGDGGPRAAVCNEVIGSEGFRQHGGARHDTSGDNTPDKFTEFMRRQTARQTEFAKPSGHAPMAPQR